MEKLKKGKHTILLRKMTMRRHPSVTKTMSDLPDELIAHIFASLRMNDDDKNEAQRTRWARRTSPLHL